MSKKDLERLQDMQENESARQKSISKNKTKMTGKEAIGIYFVPPIVITIATVLSIYIESHANCETDLLFSDELNCGMYIWHAAIWLTVPVVIKASVGSFGANSGSHEDHSSDNHIDFD